MTDSNEPGHPKADKRAGDGDGRAAPPRASINRADIEIDDNLVFDPDSAWFSDVPLIRIDTDRTWQLVRGELTPDQSAAAADAVLRWAAAYVADGPHTRGVFTTLLGVTTLEPVGATFAADPRDIATIDMTDLLAGNPTLAQLIDRVHALHDTLTDAHAAGMVRATVQDSLLTLTDAPERFDTHPLD